MHGLLLFLSLLTQKILFLFEVSKFLNKFSLLCSNSFFLDVFELSIFCLEVITQVFQIHLANGFLSWQLITITL